MLGTSANSNFKLTCMNLNQDLPAKPLAIRSSLRPTTSGLIHLEDSNAIYDGGVDPLHATSYGSRRLASDPLAHIPIGSRMFVKGPSEVLVVRSLWRNRRGSLACSLRQYASRWTRGHWLPSHIGQTVHHRGCASAAKLKMVPTTRRSLPPSALFASLHYF